MALGRPTQRTRFVSPPKNEGILFLRPFFPHLGNCAPPSPPPPPRSRAVNANSSLVYSWDEASGETHPYSLSPFFDDTFCPSASHRGNRRGPSFVFISFPPPQHNNVWRAGETHRTVNVAAVSFSLSFPTNQHPISHHTTKGALKLPPEYYIREKKSGNRSPILFIVHGGAISPLICAAFKKWPWAFEKKEKYNNETRWLD